MEIKDMEQIREKLGEEYNENCAKIDDLNNKIRIINANDIETKVISSMGFSIIPWLVSIFLLPTVVNFGLIPLNLIPALTVGIPALIGIVSEEIFTRKSKCREQLSEFSDAKTQKEKTEEVIKYEIEIEKLININKVLKKCSDDLLEKEKMITTLSGTYNITEKDVDNNEEITNIEDINNKLIEQQQALNVASTRYALKEKFWRIRSRYKKNYDVFLFTSICGAFSMLLYNMPIIYLNQLKNIPFQTSFIETFAPFIVGIVVSSVYSFKIKKDNISIFNNINKKLKDNAISEVRKDGEDKEFAKELKNIIKDTCETKLKLETEKQKLENNPSFSYSKSVMDDFTKKLDDDRLTYDKEPTTEEELILDATFIDEQVESYNKLLESPIMQEVEEPKIFKKTFK